MKHYFWVVVLKNGFEMLIHPEIIMTLNGLTEDEVRTRVGNMKLNSEIAHIYPASEKDYCRFHGEND